MLDISLGDGLRQARAKDWKRLGDLTAEAFREDPFNLWLFGNPRALKSLFRIIAKDIYLKHGFCHFIDDAGATMWAPHTADLSFSGSSLFKLLVAQTLFASNGAVKRGEAAGRVMAEHHPTDRHIYLFTIGTRSSVRGKGYGHRLLSPVLESADNAAMPVYLENTNPANTGFYNAHGFERIGKFNVLPDAPVIDMMWRKPR